MVNYQQILNRIKTGKINYSKFERTIENIYFINGASVVMGKELVVYLNTADQPKKTIHRRFTNIWMKENGIWKLTIRRATIID